MLLKEQRQIPTVECSRRDMFLKSDSHYRRVYSVDCVFPKLSKCSRFLRYNVSSRRSGEVDFV